MDNNLEKRIARLEESVRNLQQSIDYLLSHPDHKSEPPLQPEVVEPQIGQPIKHTQLVSDDTPRLDRMAKEPVKKFKLPEHMRTSEYWLNKVGIAMIILSAIFAFKYSIDKGWITPPIRIAFGLGLGAVLMFFGFKTYKKNKHFSLVLMGGSIATFYITIFAAFQLFDLVSHPIAFGCMIIITAGAYLLSMRQNESILSIIGTLGGFGTPFMLYTGSGNIPGLMLYLCLLLTCSSLIYFFKGWRLLLFFTVMGNWIVLMIAQSKGLPVDFNAAIDDRWALQSAVIYSWLTFWLLPVAREILARLKPDSWTYSPLLFGGKPISQDIQSVVKNYVHVLTVSTPLIAFGLSMSNWAYSDETWGWVMAGLAIIYGLASWSLARWKVRQSLIYTHILIGLLCFTISLSLLLKGSTLLFVLSCEALVLYLISRRLNDLVIQITSHLLYFILGIVVLVRMFLPFSENNLLSSDSLANLFMIATACSVSFLATNIQIRRVYFIYSSYALAFWFFAVLTGNWLMVLLTLEIYLIHLISAPYKDKYIENANHFLTGIIAITALDRLFGDFTGSLFIINWQTGVDILFIAIIYAIAMRLLRESKLKPVYLLASHIFVLALLSREFIHLPNGQGFVSAVWGAYAILLIISSLRLDNYYVRWTGLATLGLVVGKLLLVDLKQIDAIWRVLLFLGLGGVILFVSYYFQSLWKRETDKDKTGDKLSSPKSDV